MPDVASFVVVTTDEIKLTLPARPSYSKVVRAAAATLAVRLGWAVVEIDELRAVVDESANLLLGPVPSKGRFETVFTPKGDSLTVELSVSEATSLSASAIAAFTETASALVDDVRIDPAAPSVRLVKTQRG